MDETDDHGIYAEPAKESVSDFWLGFAAATFNWGFCTAVAAGTYFAGVWPW